MNRKEFIEQLTWLLQDIPEEERLGAIEYYKDYFDDAGIGDGDDTGDKLGCPEKVAAMIRDGLSGVNTDAGEYTETGYQDKRFKEKENMPEKRGTFQKEDQARARAKSADERENRSGYNQNQNAYNQYNSGSSRQYSQQENNYKTGGNGNYANSNHANSRRDNGSVGKIILIVILCICVLPVVLPIAGVLFGLAAGIFGLAIGLVAAAAGFTLAGIISGVILTGIGIAEMFTSPGIGLLYAGFGMFSFAIGVLMIWVTATVAGRFIPWFTRMIVSFCSIFFHRRGGQSA